jgi:hypothetical protein
MPAQCSSSSLAPTTYIFISRQNIPIHQSGNLSKQIWILFLGFGFFFSAECKVNLLTDIVETPKPRNNIHSTLKV